MAEDDTDIQSSRILKVERQARLRIPLTHARRVSWLKEVSDSVGAWGVVGPRGGLVLTPADKAQQALLDLTETPATLADVSSANVQVQRLLGSHWPLTISFEPSAQRFNLTLPSKARKLKLVPDAGQEAVVFASGMILEIWRVDRWLEERKQSWFDRSVLDLLGLVEEP